MIPYEDLVAALSAWRARQGLPVSMLGPAPSPEPAAAPPARITAPRPVPPGPPPRSMTPPPLAPGDDLEHDHDPMLVDDAALLDEHFEGDGPDFAMAFGENDSQTAIGNAPERGSGEVTSPGPGPNRSSGRNDDW